MPGTALVLIVPNGAPCTPVPGKSENEPSEVDIALTWCLDLINSNELRITADLLGRLQIIIPDDYEARQHPLNSSRLDAYLVDQYFLAYKRVLPNGTASAVKKIVENRAWQAPFIQPNEASAWSRLEDDPTGLALIIHTNTNGDYSGKTADLFKTLREHKWQQHLGCRSAKFPCNVQVFSRRLNVLIPILTVVGLDVSLTRKEDGSHCSIKIINSQLFNRDPDGNLVSASGSSSAKTTPKKRRVGRPDEPDAIHGPQELQDLPEEELRKLRTFIAPTEEKQE
jgi:hypothetical protein